MCSALVTSVTRELSSLEARSLPVSNDYRTLRRTHHSMLLFIRHKIPQSIIRDFRHSSDIGSDKSESLILLWEQQFHLPLIKWLPLLQEKRATTIRVRVSTWVPFLSSNASWLFRNESLLGKHAPRFSITLLWIMYRSLLFTFNDFYYATIDIHYVI